MGKLAKQSKAFYRGCLLGCAIGDAMTYPKKQMSPAALRDVLGEDGFLELVANESVGKSLVSNDTQLAAFTADGLIWADNRAKEKGIYAYIPSIFYGYQRWYFTQTGHFADPDYEFLEESEIFRWEALFARRVPNAVALDALSLSTNGKYGTPNNRPNTLASYGPLTHVAPIGMYFASNPEQAYKIGAEAAAITHGAPPVWYASGYLSAAFSYIFQGDDIAEAFRKSLGFLEKSMDKGTNPPAAEKVLETAKNVLLSLSKGDGLRPDLAGVEAITTLEIAMHASIRYRDDFAAAVRFAANASVGPDGTVITGEPNGGACVTGALLGAYQGSLEIPYYWIREVELSDLLVYQADALLACTTDGPPVDVSAYVAKTRSNKKTYER